MLATYPVDLLGTKRFELKASNRLSAEINTFRSLSVKEVDIDGVTVKSASRISTNFAFCSLVMIHWNVTDLLEENVASRSSSIESTIVATFIGSEQFTMFIGSLVNMIPLRISQLCKRSLTLLIAMYPSPKFALS